MFTPSSIGLKVSGVTPVSGRLSKNGFRSFFSAGVRCPGLGKTPKNWVQNFRPLHFHADFHSSGLGKTPKIGFQIFSPAGLRCPGLPKNPKFPISNFRHSLDWSETKRPGCICFPHLSTQVPTGSPSPWPLADPQSSPEGSSGVRKT